MIATICQGCAEPCDTYLDLKDGELSRCCQDPPRDLDIGMRAIRAIARQAKPLLMRNPKTDCQGAASIGGIARNNRQRLMALSLLFDELLLIAETHAWLTDPDADEADDEVEEPTELYEEPATAPADPTEARMERLLRGVH